jgi:hypothetical protein
VTVSTSVGSEPAALLAASSRRRATLAPARASARGSDGARRAQREALRAPQRAVDRDVERAVDREVERAVDREVKRAVDREVIEWGISTR